MSNKTWYKIVVYGKGIYFIKEKMKSLNNDLKEWNKKRFGNLNKMKKNITNKISGLDKFDEEDRLDDEWGEL